MENKIFFDSKSNEYSSDQIYQYLIYLSKDKFIHRYNRYPINGLKIKFETENISLSFKANDQEWAPLKHSKYFHRRGNFQFSSALQGDSEYVSNADFFFENEIITIKNFFNSRLKNTSCFGSFNDDKEDNKLNQLYNAHSIGIPIPSTLITTTKTDLYAFIQKHESIIIKPISNQKSIPILNGYLESEGTKILTLEDIELFEDVFFPVLVQEQLQKAFEIRTFFHRNKFYSMAIFSQENQKTSVDFRNYDHDKPNRCIPYLLPEKYKHKLIKLMDMHKFNTGSIDLILDRNKNLVFLEINPSGQFAWLSEKCNYNLEKTIA